MEYIDCYLCGSKRKRYLFDSYAGDTYAKCDVCGLVYQNPRAETTYDSTFWESAVDPDGVIRQLAEEREKKIIDQYSYDLKNLTKMPPGKILDVGCGLGFFLSALDSKWEKYGTDVSEFATDYARQHYPDISVFTGEVYEAGYKSNFFDVVYCFEVMEHINNPHEIINEISRVVKPGGIVMISTPNIGSYCAKRFKGNFRLLSTPHIILWSRKTLSLLLRASGLEPFKVHYPFFGTRYFTFKNLLRMRDTSKVSPPFYGNDMIMYARKAE